MNRRCLGALFLFGLIGATAEGHKPSDSYLRINASGERLSAQWDIALKDLEFIIGVDLDQDGQVTWGEVKQRESEIVSHALSRLRLLIDGHEAPLRVDRLLAAQHSDGGYAALMLNIEGPANPAHINVLYNLLFDVDPTHRGLVLFDDGALASTHVLSPDQPEVELRRGESSLWATFTDYVWEGVWHIWIGYDHILFLCTLLLPAVFTREEKNWVAVDSFRPAFHSVFGVVTAFTIAHSITLWLAVSGYVVLPGSFVEATIAASIVVTALNNLYPVLPLTNRAVAFGFGLVHGFGFANVLLDLGLSDTALAVSLLAFNVGVELGQVAIVLVLFPMIYLLRRTFIYRRVLFFAGSALIAAVAVIWFYERVTNTVVLGI